MRAVNPIVPQDPTSLVGFLQSFVIDLFNILRNISFGDGTNSCTAQNTDTRFVDGTTDVTPGTEKVFAHVLGRVPVGIIFTGQDKAGSIYKGSTVWTATNIYLKSDIASVTFKALIF